MKSTLITLALATYATEKANEPETPNNAIPPPMAKYKELHKLCSTDCECYERLLDNEMERHQN